MRPLLACGDHRRVLVAEDDRDLRLLLTRRLRRAGFEVVEACDGSDALDRIADGLLAHPPWRFDLVISDLRMPGWSGLDLLATMRTSAADVPVILITAFGSAETEQEARRLGASACFSKPFDLDDLHTAVIHLGGRDARP